MLIKDGCELSPEKTGTSVERSENLTTGWMPISTAQSGRGAPMSERLMRHISKAENGCWLWTGSVRSEARPYGRMVVGSRSDGSRRSDSAHRVSYETFKGPIAAGLCVCHRCDEPRCINPDHLFLGTKKDNADDRDRKGRLVKAPVLRGDMSPFARITDAQVAEIRASNESSYAIARRMGMGSSYVRQIRRGEARSFPPPPEVAP